MDKRHFLETLKGQLSRYSSRMKHQAMCFILDEEPKSKNAMKLVEKIKFQESILNQMEELGRKSFRGKIVCQLIFAPKGRNIPHIHTMVKNYLDLFGKEIAGKGRALVYRDDSQITYLNVRVHFASSTKHRIIARFYPERSFASDVELAERILRSEFPDIAPRFQEKLRDQEEEQDSDFNHDADDFDDEFWKGRIDEKVRQNLISQNIARKQERMFKFSRLNISDVYHMYTAAGIISNQNESNSIQSLRRNISQQFVRILSKFPFKIQIPEWPITDGQTNTFKSQVHEAIRLFVQKYPLLTDLKHPITLQAIFQAPRGIQVFSKDLDNIMRLVLPEFYKVIKPPISYLHRPDFANHPAIAAERERLNKVLPTTIQNTILGYEIINVRRTDKTSQGWLKIGLNNEVNDSIWNNIESLLRGADFD